MLEGENKYIDQAKNGRKESFGVIYSYYLPKIYRFVFLKVSNKTAAEDLTHEIFLNAWKNLRGYAKTEFPFSSWLYQIARNEVIDFYRTQKKNISLEDVGENAVEFQSAANMDSQISLEKIKSTIKSLKPEQQDVLIMRFIDDMDYDEIAAAMKKSQGAIRLIQHRALNILKKTYGQNNNNIKES